MNAPWQISNQARFVISMRLVIAPSRNRHTDAQKSVGACHRNESLTGNSTWIQRCRGLGARMLEAS
jgi:hypothetical protein